MHPARPRADARQIHPGIPEHSQHIRQRPWFLMVQHERHQTLDPRTALYLRSQTPMLAFPANIIFPPENQKPRPVLSIILDVLLQHRTPIQLGRIRTRNRRDPHIVTAPHNARRFRRAPHLSELHPGQTLLQVRLALAENLRVGVHHCWGLLWKITGSEQGVLHLHVDFVDDRECAVRTGMVGQLVQR